MTIHVEDWSKVEIDHKQAAEMWHALMIDMNAEPCEYPDLRDSLHDWISHRAAVNGEGSRNGQ